jgi:hypothetical protein
MLSRILDYTRSKSGALPALELGAKLSYRHIDGTEFMTILRCEKDHRRDHPTKAFLILQSIIPPHPRLINLLLRNRPLRTLKPIPSSDPKRAKPTSKSNNRNTTNHDRRIVESLLVET